MQKIYAFILLFSFIFAYSNAAVAMEVLIIKGPITQKHEIAVRENKETLKYLVLDTKGGGMQFAYNIMTIISYYNVTTIIPPGKSCESACTVIFQAGKQRHAGKESTLVYYAAHFDRKFMKDFLRECPEPKPGCRLWYNQMEKDLMEETFKMFRELERFGLSKAVFYQLVSTPNVDGRWLQNGNLLRKPNLEYVAEVAKIYNAVTDIVEWDVMTTAE